MTEWILVLVVFLIVLGIAAYRYRRQIQTAWFMYQTFRKFRSQMKPKETEKPRQVPKKDSSKDTPLVRCPKCGKWIAQDAAVKLKSNFYCSLNCLEKSHTFS